MSAARIPESNDAIVGATAPCFIEVAPAATQDVLAQEAISSTATNSTSQADQIARLTRELQEAKEALENTQEQQEKSNMDKDQEIQDLKKRNSVLFSLLAETRKTAIDEQKRAQDLLGAQAQSIQSLTSLLQAKQANLDEAHQDLKALNSQLSSCKENVEILQEQLEAARAKWSYYKNGCKAQEAYLHECLDTISLQTGELEELKASQKVQLRETLKAEKALLDAELHAEVEKATCQEQHTKELQSSFQAKEEVLDELQRLETLLALCEERGDVAEREVMKLNWEKRQEKTRKVARRLDFSKVQEQAPIGDQAPAEEPPLEKMPNFLLNH